MIRSISKNNKLRIATVFFILFLASGVSLADPVDNAKVADKAADSRPAQETIAPKTNMNKALKSNPSINPMLDRRYSEKETPKLTRNSDDKTDEK